MKFARLTQSRIRAIVFLPEFVENYESRGESSNFLLPTSDFQLPTSNFWHTYRFTVVFASGRQDLPSDSRAYSLKLFRDWLLFIGRGKLVQIGGGPPFFMHGLKGGGIKKYANVLPAKMLKAASGCHQQIQPIKIALYNTFY